MPEGIDLKKIDALVLEKYGADPENLIHILQEINAEYTYLPGDGIKRVAKKLKVPLSLVYSVATFYKALSLEPRGKHLITVCLGTACHVKGGQRIVEKLERDLGIQAGETTADMKFTLETVSCLGCCALAPVVVINKEVHGRMNRVTFTQLLESLDPQPQEEEAKEGT